MNTDHLANDDDFWSKLFVNGKDVNEAERKDHVVYTQDLPTKSVRPVEHSGTKIASIYHLKQNIIQLRKSDVHSIKQPDTGLHPVSYHLQISPMTNRMMAARSHLFHTSCMYTLIL